MKIVVNPICIINRAFELDATSEAALLKSHKPRAAKLANATNLLSLLGLHYATADTTCTGNALATRWLNLDPATPEQTPLPSGTRTAEIVSSVGILTHELTICTKADYAITYQHIKLYMPLNPTDNTTVRYNPNGNGTYPIADNPVVVYEITIA
jgi:hypothetical protein